MLAICVGTVWRAAHLDNRPLHADEAVQAWQTRQLLAGEGYRYDPLDRHGPTLYYGAAALHRIRGGTANDFDDRAARRFSLAAGIATLILLGFGARTAGFSMATGAMAAGLLAFETLSSLYHTYFVQEATLAFLVWAFVFLALKPSGRRPLTKALGLGVLAGLAQATKEISPLYLGMVVLALYVTRQTTTERPKSNPWCAAAVGFAVPYILFYSSFGAHPSGLVDGFKTYFLQADRLSESPHSYPWWQYFKTLGILPTGELRWGQYLLLILGLAGVFGALHAQATRAHRVTAMFTCSLLVFHSIVSYKTPWLLLTPMIGWTILAAEALHKLTLTSRAGTTAGLALLALTMGQSYAKSSLALGRYPGDIRNPYFYEQAPRGLLKFPQRIEQLQQAQTAPLKVAVISPEHAWPLPWYLRDHSAVGYFEEPPGSFATWDVVIWDNQLGSPPAALSDSHITEFYGLRPNVLLYAYIRIEVWERAFPPLPADSP